MSISAISNTPAMGVCPVFAPSQVPVEAATLQPSGITLPSGATIPFDMLAQYLLTVLLEDENQYLGILTRLIKQERAFKQMQEDVRIRHFETQLRDETHLKHIAKAGKIASKAEIVVAGIQAMLSGNVGGFVIGLVACVFGTATALDCYFDDAGKKQLASWIAQGDSESERRWLDRIHLFVNATSSIASICASIGLTLSGNTAVTLGQKVANCILSTAEGQCKKKLDMEKAKGLELDLICERSQTSLKNLIEHVSHHSEIVNQYVDTKIALFESRHQLIAQMWR